MRCASWSADFDPASVAQKTGVSAESIMRMGEWFGQSESAVAMAGTDDPALHSAVAILNAVTGNIGKTVVFLENAPAGRRFVRRCRGAGQGDARPGKSTCW